MNSHEENVQGHRETVARSDGVTPSEQYLKQLCDRSFLSLWSYPGVFRDQGQASDKGDGKEVCDLLVVFENHIIIFSDKHIQFDAAGDIKVRWGRWFRKAVIKSAQQVWGAERWIRQFPNRLFLDRQCTKPFPLLLPNPSAHVFHRIVVAHDVSRACREHLGGSGSLMLESSLEGNDHLAHPFTVGRLDSTKGYVHVFDDTSLDIVMRYLDTVVDFVSYLEKKEVLLTGKTKVFAAGEEELLAQYVRRLNENGDHDFAFPPHVTSVVIAEGEWDKFSRSDERKAQLEANHVSYAWDKLVEKFAYHLMTGTQYEATDCGIGLQEQSFRWLARENRTRRRILAKSIFELLEKTPKNYRATRVLTPSRPGEPYYVFLLLPRTQGVVEKDYRHARRILLGELLMVVKLEFPDARHIVGIATETYDGSDSRSEDFLHLDATEWNEQFNNQARASQKELGLLVNVKQFVGNEQEYPVRGGRGNRSHVSRNSTCVCGSGKRFKRCCGAEKLTKKGRGRVRKPDKADE